MSAKVGPVLMQTVWLWICLGLFWRVQPTALGFKAAIILLFIGLNVASSTISLDDLRLVLPAAVTERLGILRGAISHGR